MLATASSISATRAGLGARSCFQAAMQPTTKMGKPASAPTTKYSLGSSAPAARTMRPTTTKLIHQGERSSMANRDFSAILNFTGFFFVRFLRVPPPVDQGPKRALCPHAPGEQRLDRLPAPQEL